MYDEVLCCWPDGQQRKVVIMEDTGTHCRIIWNERVESPCKAVTGFEETVPKSWIKYE
jgi:hypothetical protein